VALLADLLRLPSLPRSSLDHILEHRTNWGELYDLLGLTPASLADFLRDILLPYMLDLSAGDRTFALNFIQRHWAAGTWALSGDAPFVAVLAAVPFVPAGSMSTRGQQQQQQEEGEEEERMDILHLAKQLFDPSVPLFANVLSTFGAVALSSTASLSAAGTAATAATGSMALFPAAPYDSPGWLQVSHGVPGAKEQVVLFRSFKVLMVHLTPADHKHSDLPPQPMGMQISSSGHSTIAQSWSSHGPVMVPPVVLAPCCCCCCRTSC